MYSLEKDFRVWYRTIHGNISSLKCFRIEFHNYWKILYPLNSLFEDCCAHFNVENIFEVNDPTEDICGAPLQENIYLHQEASPNEKKREEGNVIALKINPQRSYSAEFHVSPSYDEYYSDGESSDVEPQRSQSWEAAQEEEAHQEVNKEALVCNTHPSLGE